MNTDKIIRMDSESDAALAANGRIVLSGGKGVSMQKGTSVVNVDDMIDISSQHTRVQ